MEVNEIEENNFPEESNFPVQLGESSSEEELFLIEDVMQQQVQPNFIFQTVYSGILQAVNNNDLERVKEMVDRGFSVNINDNGGNTPLHLAVAKNTPEILDFLLQQEEIVVNSRNFSGATPLLCAVEQCKASSVEKLLKANASPNLPNLQEVSPLHLAAQHPKIAHMLILSGANLDATDYGGETPLHEAIQYNNLETVCMLLYYNTDANVKCHNGLTPFMKAIVQKKHKIQHVLLEYVDDFNVIADDGMSTLSLALEYNSPYKEEILAGGADVNYKHIECNAFEIFLRSPFRSPTDFALIWKDMKYQKLGPERDFWENICILDLSLQRPVYLKIVEKSGNIQPLLKCLCKIKSFDFLSFIKKSNLRFFEDTLTKIVFMYLCEGADLNSSHLNDIYHAYGFNQLFEWLLFQEFVPLPRNTGLFDFPVLIYDVNLNINVLLDRLLNEDEVLRIDVLANSFAEWHEESIGFIRSKNRSLLELARNATRYYIIKKFSIKSCCQFHTYVRNMDIAQAYKDILTFKKPIYVKNV